jgi:hypothetical protein
MARSPIYTVHILDGNGKHVRTEYWQAKAESDGYEDTTILVHACELPAEDRSVIFEIWRPMEWGQRVVRIHARPVLTSNEVILVPIPSGKLVLE